MTRVEIGSATHRLQAHRERPAPSVAAGRLRTNRKALRASITRTTVRKHHERPLAEVYLLRLGSALFRVVSVESRGEAGTCLRMI
jgi:hypothetical protein